MLIIHGTPTVPMDAASQDFLCCILVVLKMDDELVRFGEPRCLGANGAAMFTCGHSGM